MDRLNRYILDSFVSLEEYCNPFEESVNLLRKKVQKEQHITLFGTYENICNRNLLSTHGSEEISERLLQKKITEFLQDGVHTETTVPR
jgi:hypothetical protein